jgi:hypothetical protein
MSQTLPHCFPTDISDAEASVGFKRHVLALEDFIGPAGDQIEIVGRKLSEADIVVKMKFEARRASEQTRILYRHIRFGFPDLRGQIYGFYQGLRFGWWRSWLRGHWPWEVRWHHVAYYELPTVDCSDRLSWRGIIGRPFYEAVA